MRSGDGAKVFRILISVPRRVFETLGVFITGAIKGQLLG